jgi:hypothetical protein
VGPVVRMSDCTRCGLMLDADGTCYACGHDDATVLLDTVREHPPATRKTPSTPLPEKPSRVRLTSAARIPMKGTRWLYQGPHPRTAW